MEQRNAGEMHSIHRIDQYSKGFHQRKNEAEIRIREIVLKNGVR